MDEKTRVARNQLFQELKPCCVQLSQLALREGGNGNPKALIDSTSQLLDILQTKCRRQDGVFDEKIADYVFFPLSHVLKRCQKTLGRVAEITTQCLRVLLEFGWRRSISTELAGQLLILLSLFAGGPPTSKAVSEELQTEALQSLAALFEACRSTPKGSAFLVEESMIPALGHCLTVILDGITDGPSTDSQLAALKALGSFWIAIKDPDALSTFLPGAASALTKCLTPTTGTPRARKVLIGALVSIGTVLTICLSDVRTTNLQDEFEVKASKKSIRTKSWLRATGSQIKMALANIVKLQNHKHQDVRQALLKLCVTLLDECHKSLAESSSLLVDVAMNLQQDVETQGLSTVINLSDLAMLYPSITELMKTTVYQWITGFPRAMQSNDDKLRDKAIVQFSTAYSLLSNLSMESSVLDNAISDALRNGLVGIIDLSNKSKVINEAPPEDISDTTVMLSTTVVEVGQFRPVVLSHGSQANTRDQLEGLLAKLGTSETKIKISNDMLDHLRTPHSNTNLASLWLSFQLMKAAASDSKDIDAFLNPAITSSDDIEALMQELYSYSLSILSDDEDTDWRLLAIGLEVVTYCAESMGSAFRPDLVDTLYPVVQLLGSSKNELRECAITSLNSIAFYLGYKNTSDIIIGNVDYLVNAISLKLNTFNVSPRAPQILAMMIKLSGPSLLPYLDDVVVSMFAALDNFHGYPRLVDSLFSVLGAIVDESGRSKQLRLISGKEIDHLKRSPTAPSMDDIIKLVSKRKETTVSSGTTEVASEREDYPKDSWKSAKELLDEAEATEPREESEDNNDVSESEKVPPPKIYTMVESITRLSQHYLTSASPLLRRKLLDLIKTASSSLYKNEDQFLPLVNDIWPVLIKRLYDDEPYVVISAASAISEVCNHAGDFLATRVQNEWHDLMVLVKVAKSKAEKEKLGNYARGVYAQNSRVWEALIRLIVALVSHVRLQDDMFDEVLDVLTDLLSSREDVRDAFERVNADAVWLRLYLQGKIENLRAPNMEGYSFVKLG